METTYLRDPAFWTSSEPAAPGSSFVLPQLAGGELEGLVFFQTSGTMGQASWVGLSRDALLFSAAVVNRHLEVFEDSCWGLALPLNHVGGFGVVARAFEAGSRLDCFREKWNPARFTSWLAEGCVSHVSLVPTQVHDLVKTGLRAPSSLKVVVVGGGGLDQTIGGAARDLGWPVLASYGMTEAGSQIATQSLELLELPYSCGPIEVLPHWEVKIEGGGCIAIRGESLFSGELIRVGREWSFSKRAGDWYVTKDLGRLDEAGLLPTGRSDALVKILGELVDPVAVERELGVPDVLVVALPDPRKEHHLVAVYEDPAIGKRVENLVTAYNGSAAGFLRIDRVVQVDAIPRGDLGKVRRLELAGLVDGRRDCRSSE
ncbi:AMP-binding protein [Haloferula sp.]|uniref:AMP-binding protein n=1 Tax=Haloferula sp. TaxID=2497595 RepID=UPI003C741C2A